MSNDLPQKLGRYQVLGLLATGGMAEIFLARQTGIGGFEKLVVVKRILPHLARDKYFLDMFLDEASIAARLNHSNIAQIYDVGRERNDYYIAMEYVEGESLDTLDRDARQMDLSISPSLATGIFVQLCDALSYAHELRDADGSHLEIVHRDVSPQNILVQLTGGIKLVDFGIAKAAARDHKTLTGTLKGKLAYMSPEQLSSAPVDARSDIFALGVVLWELLSKERLFQRKSEVEIIEAIRHDPIPKLTKINPDLPKELTKIVAKALRKRPGDRFRSASELGDAVRDVASSEFKIAAVPEIGRFAGQVLAHRAERKRKLLEEFRTLGKEAFEPVILRTVLGKPAPADSEVAQVVSTDEAPSSPPPQASDAKPEKTREAIPPATLAVHPKSPGMLRWPAVLWFLIPFVLGGIGLGYLILEHWADEKQEPTGETVGTEGKDQDGGSTVPPPEAARLVPGTRQVGSSVEVPPADDSEDVIKPLDLSCTDPAVKANEAVAAGSSSEEAGSGKTVDGGSPAEALTEAPPAPVWLNVRSTPARCAVKVDRQRVDDLTPIRDLPIAPGEAHLVQVLCPGHKKGSQRAEGKPGEQITLVFAPPALSDGHDGPAGGDGGTVDGPDPALLTIRSNPSHCRVKINGKRIADRTPVMNLPVAAEITHLVVVQCEGHRKGVRRISGLPGERLNLMFKPPTLEKDPTPSTQGGSEPK